MYSLTGKKPASSSILIVSPRGRLRQGMTSVGFFCRARIGVVDDAASASAFAVAAAPSSSFESRLVALPLRDPAPAPVCRFAESALDRFTAATSFSMPAGIMVPLFFAARTAESRVPGLIPAPLALLPPALTLRSEYVDLVVAPLSVRCRSGGAVDALAIGSVTISTESMTWRTEVCTSSREKRYLAMAAEMGEMGTVAGSLSFCFSSSSAMPVAASGEGVRKTVIRLLGSRGVGRKSSLWGRHVIRVVIRGLDSSCGADRGGATGVWINSSLGGLVAALLLVSKGGVGRSSLNPISSLPGPGEEAVLLSPESLSLLHAGGEEEAWALPSWSEMAEDRICAREPGRGQLRRPEDRRSSATMPVVTVALTTSEPGRNPSCSLSKSASSIVRVASGNEKKNPLPFLFSW